MGGGGGRRDGIFDPGASSPEMLEDGATDGGGAVVMVEMMLGNLDCGVCCRQTGSECCGCGKGGSDKSSRVVCRGTRHDVVENGKRCRTRSRYWRCSNKAQGECEGELDIRDAGLVVVVIVEGNLIVSMGVYINIWGVEMLPAHTTAYNTGTRISIEWLGYIVNLKSQSSSPG